MPEDLKIKIQQMAKEALKSGDQTTRQVLNMLLTAIKNKELEKRANLPLDIENREEASQLSKEEIYKVVGSEVKKRRESIETFKDAGREELAEKEEKEMGVLQEFLPEQLNEEDIRQEVRNIISEQHAQGMEDMASVMSLAQEKLRSRADGSEIARIVQDELSQVQDMGEDTEAEQM